MTKWIEEQWIEYCREMFAGAPLHSAERMLEMKLCFYAAVSVMYQRFRRMNQATVATDIQFMVDLKMEMRSFLASLEPLRRLAHERMGRDASRN